MQVRSFVADFHFVRAATAAVVQAPALHAEVGFVLQAPVFKANLTFVILSLASSSEIEIDHQRNESKERYLYLTEEGGRGKK